LKMASISDDDEARTAAESPSLKQSQESSIVMVGGPGVAAYALLDGLHEDDTDSQGKEEHEPTKMERVTIPITSLPAILGRSHDSNDANFFGLGPKKAISRKQCVIYYRDGDGGRVEYDPKARVETDANGDEQLVGQLVYLPPDKVRRQVGDDAMEPDKLNHNSTNGSDDVGGGLPSRGFFVLECLGKNRVIVDQHRVEQGHSIVLRQGSSVRISSYLLYFLLPTDATASPHTISSTPASGGAGHSPKNPTKKRPAASSPHQENKKIKPCSAEDVESARSRGGGPGGATMNAYQMELDEMSVQQLLSKFQEAIENDVWDRRTQLLGSSICVHAVQDAARALREVARKEGYSLSRKEVVDWIAKSERYSNWVTLSHEKMESRSYISSVTRCLIRSGFVRNSGQGRYIRWIVPKSLQGGDSKATPGPDTSSKNKTSAEEAKHPSGDHGGDGDGASADRTAAPPLSTGDTTNKSDSCMASQTAPTDDIGGDSNSNPDTTDTTAGKVTSSSLEMKQESIDHHSGTQPRTGMGTGTDTGDGEPAVSKATAHVSFRTNPHPAESTSAAAETSRTVTSIHRHMQQHQQQQNQEQQDQYQPQPESAHPAEDDASADNSSHVEQRQDSNDDIVNDEEEGDGDDEP
jgi:FHA domain